MCVYIYDIYTYIYTHTHTYIIYIYIEYLLFDTGNLFLIFNMMVESYETCINICIYIHIYIYICIYIYIHTYIDTKCRYRIFILRYNKVVCV